MKVDCCPKYLILYRCCSPNPKWSMVDEEISCNPNGRLECLGTTVAAWHGIISSAKIFDDRAESLDQCLASSLAKVGQKRSSCMDDELDKVAAEASHLPSTDHLRGSLLSKGQECFSCRCEAPVEHLSILFDFPACLNPLGTASSALARVAVDYLPSRLGLLSSLRVRSYQLC